MNGLLERGKSPHRIYWYLTQPEKLFWFIVKIKSICLTENSAVLNVLHTIDGISTVHTFDPYFNEKITKKTHIKWNVGKEEEGRCHWLISCVCPCPFLLKQSSKARKNHFTLFHDMVVNCFQLSTYATHLRDSSGRQSRRQSLLSDPVDTTP